MSWTLIEHQALTSSVASVTLGSGGTIPQTYKTLKLVVSARCDRTGYNADSIAIRLNGDTANNYTGRQLEGTGSAAASYSQTTGSSLDAIYIVGPAATTSTFGNAEINFPNYTASTTKPIATDSVTENNATQAYQRLVAALWNNTAAITSIICIPLYGTNFVSGSTFTLYGLA